MLAWFHFSRCFPPQVDPAANVTIAAATGWTRITAEVLEWDFQRHILLSADQSETVDLLLFVRCPVIIPPTSFVLFLLGL